MKDRRIGRFKISKYMIDARPHHVLAVMKDMIVIRAEMMWAFDGVEYVGIHPAFDALHPGQLAPEYEATITTNSDATVKKVEWKLCS